MNINELAKQLQQSNQHPPVDQWDPPFCGDIPIEIKSDGSWFYMGTPIGRQPLVKLFASVLTYRDGEYYLVTPVEKVRIQVVQHAFVITQWRQQASDQGPLLILINNVNDEFVLSKQTPLIADQHNNPVPYIKIHRGLTAGLHRNVYYQLAELAQQREFNGQHHYMIDSGEDSFSLGQL